MKIILTLFEEIISFWNTQAQPGIAALLAIESQPKVTFDLSKNTDFPIWPVSLSSEAHMGKREERVFCYFEQGHWSWRNHLSLFQTNVNNTLQVKKKKKKNSSQASIISGHILKEES